MAPAAPTVDMGLAAPLATSNDSFNLKRFTPSEGSACVLGMGTAVPETIQLQEGYPDYFFDVTNCNEKTALKKKFARICEKSGIRKRHFFMSEERLRETPAIPTYQVPSLNARQEIAVAQVPRLAHDASVKAIKEWGGSKSDITHVVFATTSGINMPGADHTVSKLLGLRPSVRRVMLYQIGCFGGAAVMRVGKDLAENNKGARVLVIASEVTCLTFRAPNENHLDGLVGSALFGDGAAAYILGSDPVPAIEKPIFEIKWAGETLVPESDGAIDGQLTEAGLVFHLLKDVPGLISKNIEQFLTEAKKAVGDPTWNEMFWAVHPGGPAILDQVEEKLQLDNKKMAASRDILSEYGNMSSATVLFVLDEIRKRAVKKGSYNTGEDSEYGFLIGFGPGLTLDVLVLKSVPTEA